MNDFQSLVFYIAFFSLSAILYELYCQHNKKLFLVFAVLIPLMIGGLRYNVGTDYVGYYASYNNKDFIDFGFFLISSIARLFGGSQMVFFIYNALTLLFVLLSIKNIKKEYRPLAYFCYLFLFYTTSFNAMRQMLAVSVVFFSYKYAISKKIIPFIVFIAIATVFHTTAIFGAVLYLLLNTKRKFIKIMISVVVLILVFNYQNLLNMISNMPLFEHYSLYEVYANKTEFGNVSFFIELIVLGYLLFNEKRITKNDSDFKKYLFIYIIGILFLLTGFNDPYVKRIALYFTISSIVLLPSVPYSLSNKKDRFANQIIIVAFVICKFIVQAYMLGQSGVIPFEFVRWF